MDVCIHIGSQTGSDHHCKTNSACADDENPNAENENYFDCGLGPDHLLAHDPSGKEKENDVDCHTD